MMARCLLESRNNRDDRCDTHRFGNTVVATEREFTIEGYALGWPMPSQSWQFFFAALPLSLR